MSLESLPSDCLVSWMTLSSGMPKDSTGNFWGSRFPVREKLLVTDRSMYSMARLTRLRKLSLTFSAKVSTKGWHELLLSCSSLDELEVQMNTPLHEVHNTCLESFYGSGPTNLLRMVMNYCPLISKLSLPCMLFNDEILSTLPQSCPLLEELTLSKAWKSLTLQYFHRGVSEDGICTFIRRCSDLRCLSIFSVRLLTSNKIFQCLADNAPRLERLCIDGQEESVVNINALDLLASGCPLLQHLTLPVMCTGAEWCSSYFSRRRDEGLNFASDRVLPEVGFPCLTALHLGCNAWLQDHDMASIGLACPSLAILRMKYCDLLTGNALVHISDTCCNMMDLEICQSTNFIYSDAHVSALAQGCPMLKRLRMPINNSNEVTDEAIKALSLHCPLLEVLTLGGGSVTSPVDAAEIGGCFTDSALHSLSRGCLELTHLTLLGCKGIGQKDKLSTAMMLENCRRIRHVELIECENIDESVLEALFAVLDRHSILRRRLALWLENPGAKLRYESRIVQQCEMHLVSLNFCFQSFI